MASGGAEEDDGGISLDIDSVHMLLQVEHEQIQKRTFTNWINAQLAKRYPPSYVSDLFSDLRDGSQLLDLLEIMSGQPLKRQTGGGPFHQRANIETALSFLKKKSIKLVNINIPDIIDGRPTVILGLVWTIILHCHIEELASALSYSSRHSSLDSLASLDSWSGSPVPSGPVPPGQTSPFHRRFRISAKKALLMWVRDQCQRVGSSVNVKDFKSSWRSGEAFLVILCSLRPALVDLSLVQSRSNQENLEEAFHLAERKLHIPRLLDPQDVDVTEPEEKSIMTYVAQFLQYSSDMPAPDDHLQLFPLDQPFCSSPMNLPSHFTPAVVVSPLRQFSPCERTQEMTCWLQQACREVSEAWSATEKSSYAVKYQVFQSLAGSFTEQRRPVLTHLAAIRRCPELSQEQHALKTAWDRLEEALQRCKTDLDMSLPPPLDAVVLWLQRADAELTEEGGRVKDHADAAKEARAQQDTLKTLITQMNHYVKILDAYPNMDDSGNAAVPPEKFDEIKRRLTHIRVAAKYQGIKLEYRESRHTALDLLSCISTKVHAWKSPYRSQEDVDVRLQDWHETVEHQGMLLILMDAVQNLKEKANTYTSKAALDEDFQLVTRQVKEAECEAELVTQAAMAVREMMERMASAWDTYNKCLTSLQTWLEQTAEEEQLPALDTQDISGWMSCQAKLNEVGNFLTEVTETSTSRSLAEQLSKVNMQWAECMKRAKFEALSEPRSNPVCLQMVHSRIQEATWLLRQPLEVASVPLKGCRQRLQLLLKKMAEVDLSSLHPSPGFQTSHVGNFQQTLPQMLAEAERTCGELQRAASRLEGSLAELDHWSTDALDCYEHLKETEHKGRSSGEPPGKVVISRGLQLEDQVVREGQALQDIVAQVQETSPLQHLSTSVMQERISEAVAHCQEILGKFSLLGCKRRVGGPAGQPETGRFVVATTKRVDQIGKFRLEPQDPNQLSRQIPTHTSQQGKRSLQSWPGTHDMNTQDETTVVIPHVKIQVLPQPLEPAPYIHRGRTHNPFVPVSRSEVYSKAQSMARSRLEKARFRLQGRIQEAIKLFGGRDISKSQAKKKQKAFKILQPCILEEFLGAVEGFGAFCIGPELQDLMLLSDLVRKQWEDVRREMAALVSDLWSNLREGKRSFYAVQCVTYTNAPREPTDQTDHHSLQQQQAVAQGPASIEEHVESSQELCETLTASKSTCLATHQLKELDEARETQPSGTVLPGDQGPQLGGGTPQRATGMSAYTQPDNNHPLEQSVDSPQQDLSPVAGSVPLHGILPLGSQEVPARIKKTQHRKFWSGKKSSQQTKEQPLKARLLQPTQTHIQTIVRGNTVETQQDTEWTVITETITPPHEEHPSELEALERFKTSCLLFTSQFQKNKQCLEFIPDPVTISTLQNYIKLLQAKKQDSEAPWLELELQYAQLLQSPLLIIRKYLSEVERDWEQLTQEWREHRICLQSRMTSLENTAALMESAEDQRAQITQNLDQIIRESVDISSFTLSDPRLVSDLMEMDDKLQSKMKKLAEQSSEEERQQPEATSPLYQALNNSVHHLQQLRQQLEKVHSAAQALDRFLATVREVKAEIQTLLANQDPSGLQNEADWEQERHSWQAAMQQRLQAVAELSDSADSRLKAAKMTLTIDGVVVTCQDVVTSLSKHVVDDAKKLVRARKRESKDEINLVGKEQMRRKEEFSRVGVCQKTSGEDSPQEQEPPVRSKEEEDSRLEAQRDRLDGENYAKTQEKSEQKAQAWRCEGDVKDQSRRSIQVKGEKESLVQRRAALIGALRKISGAAEQLGLQEPTLPALQQRTRVLTELESRLAGLVSELQHIRDAESSEIPDEVEDLWVETTKAVTDRLEQCCVLTELMKRFQSLRGELSGTLQRAESTISEQASYVGRDNLQRLHTKVKETKAELNGLGERIEQVRSVCRQLHTHLHQIQTVIIISFESEADSLMDHWLDISERTDSHLDNLHLCLTLWDRVLQLGAEVESWAASKIAAFAQSPSFQSENDIKTLRNEIVTQEENMEHFHRRTTEIQSLLQSTEPPLELQVVETQMRKKTEQLKELVSEAEDVFRQMVAAKGEITVRLAECFSSLQSIQVSLLTLSGSDVATVLEKLKGLCSQLQTQDEQAESLLDNLRVMASIASPDSLQSLTVDGIYLQEKLRNAHQLFSEVQEQTERNIKDLDRLQRESECLEQWLQAAEGKPTQEDLGLLQEEALQQRATTELLNQLVSSLLNSALRQSTLVDKSRKLLEKYHDFHTNRLCVSEDKQKCLSRDIEIFQCLSKSTQSWMRDLRQLADSPLSENLQSRVEHKLQQAKAVASVAAEGEVRIKELRSTGNSLSQRLSDGEDLKQGVQETIQKTEEQWRDLLQSVEPYYRALQADPELTSSYLAQRQEVYCRLEELKCQTAQLPTLFPWPGTAERKQTCRLARQLWSEAESLQVTLTSLAEQGRKLAEQTSETIWKDPCWAELDTCWAGLVAELKGACSHLEEGVSNEKHFGQMLQLCHLKSTSLQEKMSACQESAVGLFTDRPALEALLQDVIDIEKNLLQLVALKDSITASLTAEAHGSISQQVSNLQNHKRALENSIRESLALLEDNSDQKVQQVQEEVSCVQAALKDQAENMRRLCVDHGLLPEFSQLKQQWCTIQDSDNRLTELAARAHNLQQTRESSITQEILPADVILTVDTVSHNLNSLRSVFLQNKQQCAENTANRVRLIISQLQQWSQTAQAELSSLSQAVLDEGLWHQQSLREVLSEKDFLLNCLGTTVLKKLEKCALDALHESTSLHETLSKCLVKQGHSEEELENIDLMSKSVGDTFRNEGCTSAFHEETTTMCPAVSSLPSTADNKANSESDRSDSKMEIKSTQKTALQEDCASLSGRINSLDASSVVADATKQDQACICMQQVENSAMCAAESPVQATKSYPIVADVKSQTQLESQQLAPAPPDHSGNMNRGLDINPQNSNTKNTKPSQEDSASILDSNICIGTGRKKEVHLVHCATALVESPLTKPDEFPVSTPGNVSTHTAEQSQAFKINANAQDQEKLSEDISIMPKKVFTIVLDMQKNENVGPDVIRCSQETEICDQKLSEVSSMQSLEKKSRLLSTVKHPESDKTSFKTLNLPAQSDTSEIVSGAQEKKQSCEDISVRPKKVLTIVLELQPQDMKQEENVGSSTSDLLRCSEEVDQCDTNLTESRTKYSETNELMHTEVLSSFSSCGPECQFTDAHEAETFPHVSQEEVTDCCQTAEETTSSEGLVQTGDVVTQIYVGDDMMGANTAQNTASGHAEMEKEDRKLELLEPKHAKVPQRRDEESLLREESESKFSSSLVVSQRQPEIQISMEPERTAQGVLADLGAGEMTSGDMSAMQEILSEIQSAVERSSIINRASHIDLRWFQTASPDEPEIRLVHTVQKILTCRYQPAKLNVTAMSKQLEEAEEHRRCVEEQVATMRSMSASKVCDPNAFKSAEGQLSAALLDASATVQVKAAQLELVKQYHKQMKMARAFLEVLAAEKEKMSLTSLGSSATQTDKLHALMQTMKLKRGMMEELIQLSSQLSVHLSDAESSGALLAWLGDVQEEWRLLEGSIKRALRHASNSTSQFMLLMKEAKQLKVKLEGFQKSSFQSSDSKSDLELVCLTTDLKLHNQLYLHLQSQSNALIHFSLGQKEKDEIQRNLQELGSLLNATKRKLDTSTYSCNGSSAVNINKQLRNLIMWAKQAENHISTGKQLALFPEEARIQISEMKKFQTDILSRRSKMQEHIDNMKDVASDMEKEESDQVLKTIEDLYEAIADSLDRVLDTMKESLQEREKLLTQLASLDAWLAETLATRDRRAYVDNVSKVDLQKLESELHSHKLATVEIERQLNLVEAVAESCKELAVELSPGESRYLANRLSGLWTELDGLLAHEKAASWEIEELIHERTSSDEELSTIQASLKLISTDLEQQRFPLTHESISVIARLKHMLMEHQCQVQELKHCQEAKRSLLLYTIGELQDRCKALSLNAFEHDKYMCLRRRMEKSRDNVKEQIQRARDETISVGKRFKLCQTLLVEFPFVKTQCQEVGDQLEVISQDLYPSELNSERQRIHHTVETLVSWEHSVTDDIRNLESKLILGLCFSSELPALFELFQKTKEQLEATKPVDPDEKAVDAALQRYWVFWRNMESGMRVLEALGEKERINLSNNNELFSLRDTAMQECHLQMDNLSQAQESLKNYRWAAQGAIIFLHNAEATFLSAPGGFLDCTEEQRQTQQALKALEDGFQTHFCHLMDLVPQQTCLCRPKTEQLHINILSQLLVGRAVLEAQAQLRLELLQRCVERQQSHRSCHEDIHQCLSEFEARLSKCTAAHITSYDKCVAQQKTATVLMGDLHNLAGKIELWAGCPMPGCGVGKDGELGALWRRWVSLRREVGVLMAHTEQRGEEWKDITTSMEQCCSSLASLQAEVPDSSIVSFTREEPQELLAQAEMHNAGLEQEQQALASLEHRLEHALSLSTSHDVTSPGPVGKTLVKIQENVRSLKERNLLVVAAAQAEEKERDHFQEEIREMEKHLFSILPMVDACSDPSKQQDLKKDLSSHKAKLNCIMEGVQTRYRDIPADISRRLQEVQFTLQRAEEKLVENSSLVRGLAGRMMELSSGLKKVKVLLEQKSQTVNEAQNVLKLVWDELDVWHSRLMVFESEVQDLSEEQPAQAHLLMDHLTEPLQLYQNTAQMAEQRTSFLSKIPACLQEFEDILYSATCWLDEAQTWLSTPCSFTTARSLQSHANSLQLVLDDSARIRDTLRDFTSVLAEISAVCDISTEDEKLKQNDQQVHKMQRNVLERLQQLLQAVEVVNAMEAELKTMEKNVLKIRTILSSMENSNIRLTEHLNNQQVILANVHSMQRTLEEMEKCKGELHLPEGSEESLTAFSRARLLLQQLEELENLTRQQASLVEIKEEEEPSLGLTTSCEEAFEMSNSEEEEDEDDESCHSSSSDTLTCSIPEDPEDTLNSSEVEIEDIAEFKLLPDVKEQESLGPCFSPEGETSSTGSKSGLVKPGFDTSDFGCKTVETGLKTMDSRVYVGEAFSPKTATSESLIITAAKDKSTADTPEQRETRVSGPLTKSLQAAAAMEDTRLIPARPITPFAAAASLKFLEGGDEDLCLPTAAHQDLDTLVGLREQQLGTSQSSMEESQAVLVSSKIPVSGLTGHEEDGSEQQSWGRLHTQISQILTTLKRLQEERQTLDSSGDGRTHEEVPERELVSPGSASAVHQWTHESISLLRQTVSYADRSDPGVKEDLYLAVRRVVVCLDSLTDRLSTPGDSEVDAQLRLLQQECASAELVTLAELLNKLETNPALWKEEPDAVHCLTCLQECLRTLHLFTSSRTLLLEHLGTKNHQELSSSQMCILDEFDLGQNDLFPSLKEAHKLELCVLGRHLRESPGEKAKLQQASWSLLQGITRLLELGEECISEAQMSQVHSCSQLQTALCGHKKLLQVLGSQLAFVQHLFQREPEALKCQEDERLQLEVRAKALLQQAVEQEVAFQTRLQERTRWEDNCGRLGRVLDEVEAFISSREPEGDDEDFVVQHRLDACQQTLVQLDNGRAAVGLLLDHRSVLQKDPGSAPSVDQAGGALELRWRSAYRWTEQEIQRCRDIQNSWARFQTNFASVSEWLVGANKHLKSLSDVVEISDLNQECIYNHLIKLLDLSMEVEAMSVQRVSVSREATLLLRWREADCPRLRSKLAQLDVSWSQLTSGLSKIQEQLQQRLLASWPPVELLSALGDYLKRLETRLNNEKENVLKAKAAAQITEVLQHYQEVKAGVISGQVLLDFLCQSGPQLPGGDIQALQSERTMFAETLGALKCQWLHLQRELETQICGAEQIHHTCADRERRLKRIQFWKMQQREQLNQWKQLTSQNLIHKALLEWETVVGKVREVTAAVQELKAMQVNSETEDVHPSDIAFSYQADSISQACGDLIQQMEVLRPTLQQTVTAWSCYDRGLREVTLHSTRLRCTLQHQRAPLFSLKQAEGYVHLLQQLQGKVGKGEEIWVAVEKSYQGLITTLQSGTVQALGGQMEGERKRWKDLVQALNKEHVKTGATLSLWQEYSRLSESCSLQLQDLWHQWEELTSSSLSPEQDTHDVVHSVETLQDSVQDLQQSVGDVLEASKCLTEHLDPVVANVIQSEARRLSSDILLLNQTTSGKKRSLQYDMEEQKLFHSHLAALDKQLHHMRPRLEAGLSDSDSVKVFLELTGLSPSLVDIRNMSGYVTLNKQGTDKLHMLTREWIQGMTRASNMNRELQAESQHSQHFQEKCKNLASVAEKLEQELVSRKAQSYSNLQEMLTIHQRLQAEIITGHQLLQGLLCEAVTSMEKETGEKRSELVAQVSSVKERWLNSAALAFQSKSLVKEQLQQWRIYHCGSKLLWKLLRDVGPLLPPTGPAPCALPQLHRCLDVYQRVEEALGLYSTVYSQTLKAGRLLCGTMTESESQSRLQSECRALEEAWERSTSLLGRRTDLVSITVKWRQCQDGITSIVSELDELKTRLKQQLPGRPEASEEEKLLKETELSLQRLARRLSQLGTMKTDLSQYAASGDSALLEQQLEQLHGQWEELCMKVSLHRQEIADRLNAWTIFNDKNKEFCDWLTQMENKVCHSGDLSIEEMVEKLKKDCMEEINLFSENKSHLKQLGEQLLLASDEAKQTQIHGSLQEVNQRWHNLFNHIEARVKKLKETLVTVQQLDKNMSNLRSWLSRIESELSRPITYSVCHHQEIQRRLAEQQELQRDIEQHTEGVASVLSLCDVLLRDEDAAGGIEVESDSLQETSRSLDQRWRTICAMALDRRLRIEETWRLWCKFLDDYSRFEDWLKMAERTAANPNSADVLYTVAKEELKRFEGFQRQVHERLTQLELVNNQYRRLARENRTDRASQLKAMVHEGNRRWDTLHRRVAVILRRLKYFTSQREEFESTKESILVWLTELDLQLTNVEHFSESDVDHKMQQLNSFQKEITLNTERIDELIVFGEGLIQKSSPQDAALIEDELEELHSYCQEVFSRLVRFHQRLSQPPKMKEEPELSGTIFSLESRLELICRPRLGRSQISLPATPTHLLASPLERSGRETPDSLPLEWDPSGDVGGSSSHEDEEEEEEDHEGEGTYFSALSVPSRSGVIHESPRWRSAGDTQTQLDSEEPTDAASVLTSTPLKQSYLSLASQCSGSIEDIKRVSLILDDEEQPQELGLTALSASGKQSGVIERWELIQARSRSDQQANSPDPQQLTSDLDNITSWLGNVIPELDYHQQSDPAASIADMELRVKELKEMQKTFARYRSIMLSVNLRAQVAPELQERLASMNRDWCRACTGLQQWETSLRKTLMRCQEFHETLHSLLLWLAHAESTRYAVDIRHPDTPVRALQQHRNTLTHLQKELWVRQAQQAALQALWSQLQPDDGTQENADAREKLHVTGSKLKLLLKEVDQDLSTLQQCSDWESVSYVQGQRSSDSPQEAAHSKKHSATQRERRDSSPPRSFFYRVLRAAFPLHLLLLFLLLLPCLIPLSESDSSCTVTNNFARSFHPMLQYTNGPPPT